MKIGFAAVVAFVIGTQGAQAFERVSDVATFNTLVAGKELRIGLYGLSLLVTPDGAIAGRAVGYDITGGWSWQNGYFCRQMDWSGTEVPYNCQLVEVDGDRMRFTTDQGAGDDAVFRLR